MAADGRLAAAATFLVFLLLANASADESKCNQGCFGSAKQGEGFLPGTAYTYDFEGLAKVQLSSADHQETSVKISAKAVITNLGNCAHLLKITTIDISTPDGTKYPKPRNINKAVRFVLQDGVLGSDICVEDDDNQASVNIKRAVLSMLQTATKHNTEVDIFGVCPTSFKTRKESGNVVITKYRDLNTCAHREQGKNDLIAAIYNPNAEIKSTNILDSNLRVETAMKNGIVQRSDAMEDYTYVPFSSGSSGAKAQVTTKMVLKETKPGFNIQANCVVPKSIIFENPHLDSEYSNTDNIQLALKTASQSMDNNVDSKSASVFVNLVRVLRSSNKNDIYNVYKQIKGGSSVQDNNFMRKVFLDALFRAGTGETVEVSVELVLNKELSPLEERLALISLSTSRHATSSSIKSAMKLFDAPNVSDSVYMGVGSLAGAYCRDHTCHGATSQDANIAALSNKLAGKLGNCKAADKKTETSMLYALKGLRNIHHIEDSIVPKLVACATDKSVKPRIRVAVLETFAADPCIKKLKTAALSILKDRQQDSEIRIKAYLALLDCPCANVAGELKKMLDDEPVYQVGAFITSSLKNIRSSTNPSRKAAKDHFGLIHPKKKYPFDIRKYSQNFELSYEYEMFGIGSNVDANVIYSQDSFMPRSANLNLTTELFGRNINLIELGYRQGNLDRIVEEYFGPQGEIHTHTPQEIYKGVKKTTVNFFDHIQKKMQETRGKRSVLQQTNNFGKNLKHDVNGYNGNVDLDIFLKMFGSEVVFLSLGDDKPASFESLVDKFFAAMNSGISDANHFTHEIRNHMILLDSELAFPTTTGFALKLNAEAAATTKIQFSGNVDIKQIMNDPKNCKIDFKLVPSANIEATGTLLIDADVVASGLKVMSSLHTSTGSHIVTKLLDNGQGFDMQIGLPVDKQELISANHEIMYITRPKSKSEIVKDIKFDSSNRYQFNGCFDQLASAIGLTLCSDISIPWNPVNDPKNNQKSFTTLAKGPLSGPSKLAVRLEKEDLNGFHITGTYKTVKETQKILDISVEANGAKKKRKVTFVADVINRDDRRSIKLSLTSPIKSANMEAEAAMINSNTEKSLMARVALDKTEYMGKLGMQIAGNQAKTTITPILQFKTPSNSNNDPNMMQLTGSIIKTHSGKSTKFTANNICLVMPNKAKLVEVDGFFQYEGSNGQIDLNLSFNNDRNKKAKVSGKYEIQEHSYKSQWDVSNTIYPTMNFHFDVNSALANDVKTFDFTFMHGEDQKQNKIKYSSKTKAIKMDDLSAIDFYFENKFDYPLWELKFETETEVKPKKFKSKVEAAYTHAYKTKFFLEAQKDMKTVNDFYGKINLNVNDNGFGSEIKFDVTGQDKGNYNFKFNSRPGENYQATGTVNYHLATDDTNVGFSIKLRNVDKPDEIRFEVGLVQNLKIYNSFCKISKSNKDYVDFNMKVTQDPAPSGTMKLFLNDLLKCDGQFKVNAQDKKGNGVLLITFIKPNKKIMLETNFLMSKPQYNANVDIYYDYEKDNSKKITIVTTNTVTDENVDSKVSLVNGNDKIDFTLKGEVVLTGGAFFSGRQNVMTTLSHSNGPSISWKFDRKMENDIEIIGQVDSQLTFVPMKNEKPHKLNFQAKIQNQNKMDLEYHLTYVKPSGEDLDMKVCFKRTKNGERSVYENQVEFTGAILPNTISYYGSFDMNNDDNTDASDVKYRIKSSYGPQTSMDASGRLSYDIREGFDKLYKSDVDATLTLPFEDCHNVKISSKDLFKISKDNNNDMELKSDCSAQVNSNLYKYQFNIAGAEDKGHGLFMVQVPNHNKFLTELSYAQKSGDGNKFDREGKLNVEYGDNQKFLVVMNGHNVPRESGNFVYDVTLPSNFKSAKQIRYTVDYKLTGNDAIVVDFGADLDGKKHTLYCNFDFVNPNTPVIEVKGSCPNAKPYRLFIKANALDIKSVKGEAKIENFGKFNMDMNVDAMLQSADEFRIKVNIDCEPLNLKKIEFEAFNEGESKGVKKIQFSAKENNKNVLSGSTTYESRKEGGKYIMEGSGTYKLRDQQKSTNFKYIRNKITESDEKGVEVFFNVALGEKSTAIEYKLTNKIYKWSGVYCEEKKQCSNVDVVNKLDSGDKKLLHNLEISADLRKVANIPEFGLKTFTEWERFKLPTHTFDIYFTVDKFKYFTQSYAKTVDDKYVTAFTVNLPQRVLSLESSTTNSVSKPFPFLHEVVLYPNKKASRSKSMFKINFDIKREVHKFTKVVGDVTVSSPVFSKDLVISGNSMYDVSTHGISSEMTFDIFKTKKQEIVMTYHLSPICNDNQISAKSNFQMKINEPVVLIKLDDEFVLSHTKYVPNNFKLSSVASWTVDPAHKGPNKKECNFVMEINKDQQTLELNYPGVNVIKYSSNLIFNQDILCGLKGSVSVFRKEPVTFNGEIKTNPDYSFKFTSGTAARKLVLTGLLAPSKNTEFKAEVIEGKQQKNLFNFGVKMENKAYKPDVRVNDANIKQYATALTNDMRNLAKTVIDEDKNLLDQASADVKVFLNVLKNNFMSFEMVNEKIKAEVKKITTELENDKALQEYMKTTNEFIKSMVATLGEVVSQIAGVVQEATKFISTMFDNTVKMVNEKLIPELTKLYAELSKVCIQITDNIANLLTYYFTAAYEFYEKNLVHIQPLIDSLNSICKDALQILTKTFEQVSNTLNELFQSITKSIKNSPLVDRVKEMMQQFNLDQVFSTVLDTTSGFLCGVLPTEESVDFVRSLTDYLKMKIEKQSVDDMNELKMLSSKFEKAVESLLAYLKSIFGDQNLSIDEVPQPNFVKFNNILKFGLPSFSVLNFLEREKLPTIEELVMAYRPKSYNPLELIPPFRLKGIIAGGQHIFTFDGRHMTFPGSCKYVVSQDAVDGNFSIVITLDKGMPKTINVVDKAGNDVEVNLKRELLYKGSPYGFPLIKGGMLAFKNEDSFTIKTQYGARVRCTFNLDMCYFEVSGFYLGKLRGLLGDGNNEPYDDFRLPNGQISTSEAEFGNAYSLNSGCARVKTVHDHSHHHGHSDGHHSSGICNKIFSKSSGFSLCYYALNPDNYRQACEHATQGVPEEKAKTEGCLIARAYTLACNSLALPTPLPDICSQCEVDGTTYKSNQEFDVVTPQNQADIILAVETTKANERVYKELVVPLVSNVIEELKKNKVTDVKVYLVGVSPKIQYPIYYDIKNNKLEGSKIDFKDELRSKRYESPITTENEKVDRVLNSIAVLIQKAHVELGLNAIHLTYANLGKLQLRPKAVNTVIMVHSEPCATAIFPLFQIVGSAISETIMKDRGTVAHLITPLDLNIKGKQNSEVVGFNKDNVFLTNDKKRGMSHADLKSALEYENEDACMSHALESFGNVYSSKNFLSCDNKQKRPFLNMMSQTIVDSLVRVTLERECECEKDIFTLKDKLSCSVKRRSDKRKPGSKN